MLINFINKKYIHSMKKLPKWDFLFSYKDYITNIDNSSNEEHNFIFEQLKIQHLSEGLILTYDPNKSCDILNRNYPEIKSNVETDGEIFIEGDFKELSNYLPLINNLGYFISNLTIDGNNWVREYSSKTIPIGVYLEPKYDVIIKEIPKKLYHTSLLRNERSILKNGLSPRSNNKRSNHPDRIYLTDSLNNAKLFGNYIKTQNNEPYSIYEIDTTNFNTTLYRDINLANSGYYILGNISPNIISKII